MGINKNLFSVSVLTLVLRVLFWALLYSPIVGAPNIVESPVVEGPVLEGPEPLFGIDVTYGYAESRNTDSRSEDGRVFQLVVNYTLLSEVDPCDAVYEVHQIEVYSDEGPIGTLVKAQGIMFNHSTSTLKQGICLTFDEFAEYGDVSPGASGCWPVNMSALLFFVGDKTSCVLSFGEPDAVFVRVSRLGLVTLKDGSSDVAVLSEPEVVAEVQLDKFGDGFLYNSIIPEEKLVEVDLFNPFMWIFPE